VPAPPLFSCVESYQPATVAGLVCLRFVWGTALPHSPAEHPMHQPLLQALSTQSSLGGAANPTFSDRLVYLKFVWVPDPPPFSGTLKVLCPFCYCPFQFLVFYSIFFPRAGLYCPEGYAGLSQGWLWGHCVPLICSPVGLHLPSRLEAGVWQRANPPGFSEYHGMEKLWAAWGLRGGSFACSWWFFLPGVSPESTRFLLYGVHAICFLPLATIMELSEN
jgi:hypothetical protein